MKQNIAELIDQINNEQIKTKLVETTMTNLKKDVAGTMQPLYDFIVAQISKNELGGAQLVVDDVLAIRVEMNVINLPIDEPARIEKFMSDEEEAGVNVYLVAVGEKVNQSGLRIDAITNADEFRDHLADYETEMNDWVQAKIDAVEGDDQGAIEEV